MKFFLGFLLAAILGVGAILFQMYSLKSELDEQKAQLRANQAPIIIDIDSEIGDTLISDFEDVIDKRILIPKKRDRSRPFVKVDIRNSDGYSVLMLNFSSMKSYPMDSLLIEFSKDGIVSLVSQFQSETFKNQKHLREYVGRYVEASENADFEPEIGIRFAKGTTVRQAFEKWKDFDKLGMKLFLLRSEELPGRLHGGCPTKPRRIPNKTLLYCPPRTNFDLELNLSPSLELPLELSLDSLPDISLDMVPELPPELRDPGHPVF